MGADLSPKSVGASAWPWTDLRASLPRRGEYAARSLDDIRYIVLHHSAVTVDSTAESIADYHLSLGWAAIGYHFLAHWDGRLEYVGEMQTARANVYGRNKEVLGICVPGNFLAALPPEPALSSLEVLLRYLLYLLPGRQLVGHGEIALPESPTSCPGPLLVPEMRRRLAA